MVAVTHARKTRKTTRKTRPVVEYKDPVPIHSSLRNENRAWEPEEDEVLLDAVQKLGAKWKMIAQTLVGRSEAMCRNRFQRINAPLKGAPSRNKCTTCGELKRGHTCYGKRDLVVEGTGGPTFAASPRTIDNGGSKAATFAPRPRRPSLPANLLVPAVTDGGFEIDPELAEAMCLGAGAPEPSPAGALGASALLHLGFAGPPDADTGGADADVPIGDDGDGDEAAGISALVEDDIGGEATFPLSVRFPAPEEDEADSDADSDADYRGPTPTPREIRSPVATPCEESRMAPPRPARLAHSFDLGSLLAQWPAGDDSMMVPLDAVAEALLLGDGDVASSQESIGESINTLPPMLPPTLPLTLQSSRPSEGGVVAARMSEKVSGPLYERDATVAPLGMLPSWSRPPSFSCFGLQ